MIKLTTINSLEKYFGQDNVEKENSGSCFLNEIYNFQVIVESDQTKEAAFRFEIDENVEILTYEQKFIPGSKAPADGDGYYIFGQDSYPDALIGQGEKLQLFKDKKIAIWVSCKIKTAGKFKIEIEVDDAKTQYELQAFDFNLDENKEKITNWVHIDCICDKHNVEPFTEEFYSIFEKYLKWYVLAGNNMLFTPIFTPPLDTKRGNYRKTCQLVKVKKEGENYSFDFTKLKEYIEFGKTHGIKYFELSHILTQWGGKFCAKIEDENKNRIFGWDVKSKSKKYFNFITQYAKAMSKFICQNGYENLFVAHISDEPTKRSSVKRYIKYSNLLHEHLKAVPIIDACNNERIISKKAIDIPVVATDHPEVVNKMKDNWMLYYACLGTDRMLTNRFLYMPLQRVRVLGYLLYLLNSKGFLQWAFNFYYSQFSLREIDPYTETDAGGEFPSGDSYIVYPSKDEVYPSIRLFVLREAFQDYSALKTAERLTSRDKVLSLLKEYNLNGLCDYEKGNQWHLELRRKINNLILNNI